MNKTFTLSVMLCACAYACGGSTSTTPGNGPGVGGTGGASSITGTPVAQADFPSAFASANCDHIAACCTQYGFAFDHASCVSAAQASGAAFATIDPTTTRYDPAAAGDCLAQLAAALAACVYEGGVNPVPACDHFLVGILPPGAACSSSDQCAPQAGTPGSCQSTASGQMECSASPASTHGHAGDACRATCTVDPSGGTDCSARPVGGTGGSGGAPAVPSTTDCYTNDNLYCSTSQVCTVVPGPGSACPDGQCQAGSYCDLTSGKCALAQGMNPCNLDQDCAAGSYCGSGPSLSAGQCTPRLADGAVCSFSSQCRSGGCNQSVCGPLTVASTKTCSGHIFQ